MKLRILAYVKFGRKYFKKSKYSLYFRKFLYLCNPLIEDYYAQPADSQLVRENRKF